jgi:VWFA-related protein
MIKRFVSLVFLAVSPLLAQQPAEPFKEKLDVNLVLLDATVTDNRGNQILGLAKDDFVVRENGVAQQIDSLEYFTSRKLLDAAEKNAAFKVERVHDERYLVFFFDKPEVSAGSDPTRIARHELSRFVEDRMRPEDRVAVVGHDFRLKVYTDFTADRKTVLRALDEVTKYGRGLLSPSEGPAAGPSILRNIDPDRMMNATGTVYEALQTLGDALRPLRARKDMVLFSAGIVAPDEDVRGQMVVNTSRFYQPAVNSLNRSNVAVYAINLNDAGVSVPEYVHQNLSRLATDTNGDYFRFHTSFVTPLKQIEKRTVGYYLISYYSQKPKGKRGFQPVEVTLKNPEFRVHARAGYSLSD